MYKFLLVFFIVLLSRLAGGQDLNIPLGDETYHIYDRLEIKRGINSSIHSSIKYYLRNDVSNFALGLDTINGLSTAEQLDLASLLRDNNEWLFSLNKPKSLTSKKPKIFKKRYRDSTETDYEYVAVNLEAELELINRQKSNKKPFLKYFYKTPANFLSFRKGNTFFNIDPIINLKLASAKEEDVIYTNQIGISIRGTIDKRLYFSSRILQSKFRYPDFVNARIDEEKVVPGTVSYKEFNGGVFNINNGYSYLNGTAYLGFNITKNFGLQLGRGKHFIGNGYRSLFLSDYSDNYYYLKFNTKIWKFHYQNIFAKLSTRGTVNLSNPEPVEKYMAAHYLSYKPTPNLSFGFFEAIIFNRPNQFEFQYLNPLIIYRTVEQFVDSPDNVLIGLDAKWNFLRRFSLYGQLMMDEFKFDELFIERRGWWANKYGIQLGLKYIDVLSVDHLDLQIEFNSVRPYTYQHRNNYDNYTHASQALAHPLGANFREFILKMRYQIIPKLTISGSLFAISSGEDIDDSNWGTSLLYSYNSRIRDFNNNIGQGIATDIRIARIDMTYQLFHNVYVDLHYFYRKKDSTLAELNATTNYIGGGIRMNIANTQLEF